MAPIPPAPDPSGAVALEPMSRYRAGAVIAERYRLVDLLGRGGMGEVWSARHLALGTEVAVKFLASRARLALERFRFEAQVSARLGERTAHIVAVRDAGEDAAGPYLAMDCVRGRTLRDELTRAGPLAPEAVATILDQVAEALAVAHAAGVVHRDLKPGNLLLAGEPGAPIFVKVADFGIAKAFGPELGLESPHDTADGWMVGSPAYMSPETSDGEGVDARADRWALAVIAYEALTGKLPFAGPTLAELRENRARGRFEPPSTLCPALPRELDAWFGRALARRPGRRFGSVAELARTFRAAAAGQPRSRLHAIARRVVGVTGLVVVILGLHPTPDRGRAQPEPGLESAPRNRRSTRVPFHRRAQAHASLWRSAGI